MRKRKAAGLIALVLLCTLCLSACQESTEAKYNRAQKLLLEEKYFDASNLFDEISAYEDSSRMSMYTKALALAENGEYDAAFSNFRALGDYKDCSLMITYYTGRKYESQASATDWSPLITAVEYYDMVGYFLDSKNRAETCRKTVYDEAVRLAGNGEFGQAIEMLNSLSDYSDSAKLKQYYIAFKSEKEERFAEASAAFSALGDYKNSAQQASQVLQRGYDKAVVLERAGNQEEACAIFASLGDYEDAFERANKPYYDQGIAKREEKDWDSAIKAFEKAGSYSDAETQILETRYQQAEYKREQKNWDEAIQLFTALGEYKDSALQVNETRYQQANALEENGDQQGAYDLFIGLGRYKDSYDRANKPYYDLGIAKREAQEWDDAIAAFSKIGQYNDTEKQINETYYQQASALETTGDLEGAYALFLSLGEYSDAYERANKPYYDLGIAKREAGEWEKAIDAFTRIITYSDAAEQIRATYYAEGQTKRAEQDWEGSRKAFANAGDYADSKQQIIITWYMEGEARQAENDWNGARTAFDNAGEYKDSSERIKETYYREAASLEETGNPEEAIKIFIELTGYADSDQRVKKLWYDIGLIRQEADRWDEAIEAFKAVDDNEDAKKHIEECLYQKAVSLCGKTKTGEATPAQAIEALMKIGDDGLFKQAREMFKEGNAFDEEWAAEFTTGNTILLGKYEQDNDPANGPEPISWVIAYAKDGKALLLSEKVIDAMSFMEGKRRSELNKLSADESWHQSEIYQWLKNAFTDSFSEQEKALFTENESGDVLYIFDNIEYKNYCGNEDIHSLAATSYALAKDENHHDLHYYKKDHDGNRIPGAAVIWWIRTGAVKEEGYLYPDDLGMIAGVRPAVWVCYEQGPTDEWIDNRYTLSESK